MKQLKKILLPTSVILLLAWLVLALQNKPAPPTEYKSSSLSEFTDFLIKKEVTKVIFTTRDNEKVVIYQKATSPHYFEFLHQKEGETFKLCKDNGLYPRFERKYSDWRYGRDKTIPIKDIALNWGPLALLILMVGLAFAFKGAP